MDYVPVIYERTDAISAQSLYLFAADGDPDDTVVVDMAHQLDQASGPSNARGQATVRLRDFTYARYHGDLHAAEQHAEAAVADLSAFPLLRHEDVVAAQRYLVAA